MNHATRRRAPCLASLGEAGRLASHRAAPASQGLEARLEEPLASLSRELQGQATSEKSTAWRTCFAKAQDATGTSSSSNLPKKDPQIIKNMTSVWSRGRLIKRKNSKRWRCWTLRFIPLTIYKGVGRKPTRFRSHFVRPPSHSPPPCVRTITEFQHLGPLKLLHGHAMQPGFSAPTPDAEDELGVTEPGRPCEPLGG